MDDQKLVHNEQPPAADQKECRRYNRFPCSEATHFLARQRLHEGVIKNISQGGTYIETEDFFFAGQEITVAGPFESDGKEVKQKGDIVRCDGRGIGVRFKNTAP
ncbi:MAG: PilZ domain-containing protein [Desulfobacterales bacterium]|jgi:hypothetical protein